MVNKRRDTETRRAQIIKAAQELIPRYGSENVTVRRLAQAIGVTEPAIYRHFKSKKGIMSALLNSIEEDLLGDLASTATSKIIDMNILEIVIKSHLSAIKQRHGISFQILSEIVSLGDKRLNKKAFEVVTNYTQALGQVLKTVNAAGALKEDAAYQSLGILVYSVLQGLTNYWAISNYSINIEKEFDSVWKSLQPVFT